MSNIDLIEAIEDVQIARTFLSYALDENERCPGSWKPGQIDYARLKVTEAESRLADCMIQLQSGYDLALLPKARV